MEAHVDNDMDSLGDLAQTRMCNVFAYLICPNLITYLFVSLLTESSDFLQILRSECCIKASKSSFPYTCVRHPRGAK